MNRFFYDLNPKLIENEEVIDQCDPVRKQTTKVGNYYLFYHTNWKSGRQRFRQLLVTHAVATELQIFAISRLIVQK